MFGRLGRPHGLRGELVLRPYNPGGADLCEVPLPLEIQVGGAARTLIEVRRFGPDFLVRLAGIESREQAAQVVNQELALPRAVLPPPDEDEFYVEDLIGCEVVDPEGRRRGVVQGSYWNGAHDVLVVADEQAGELLVPAVPAFVIEVDLAARRLVVDPHD